MPQATGATTKILGLTEDTFNAVPAVPDAQVLYVRTFELNYNAPREQDPTLAGGFRGQLRGVEGRSDVSGSAAVSMAPQSIGFWLKHLIGAPTTTGAGPYVHTFAVGEGALAIPPGIMFEQDFSDRIATPGRFIDWNGNRIESAQFVFNTGAPAQVATFNIRGAGIPSTPAVTIDATPSDAGHSAWVVGNISLVLDDGALEVCIESLTLNWNNNLDTDLYCLNNGGQRHALPEGDLAITGEGVAQFDTPALMLKAFADEDLKVVVTLSRGDGLGTAGNESLAITIPLSSMSKSVPPVNGPRGLKQPFNFVAHRVGGAEIGVNMVLKNELATV
ncbi:MAG: phage tail tube protein [Lysobacter sp.]